MEAGKLWDGFIARIGTTKISGPERMWTGREKSSIHSNVQVFKAEEKTGRPVF